MNLYIRLMCEVLTDAKVVAVGLEASMVWVRGLLYSKLHLTDGFIPGQALPVLALGVVPSKAKTIAAALVQAGLWTEVEGGWHVGTDKWARYQTTKQQVEDKRDAWRDRQAKSRELRRKQREVTDMSRVTVESGHGYVTRDSHDVTLPESESESESEKIHTKSNQPTKTSALRAVGISESLSTQEPQERSASTEDETFRPCPKPPKREKKNSGFRRGPIPSWLAEFEALNLRYAGGRFRNPQEAARLFEAVREDLGDGGPIEALRRWQYCLETAPNLAFVSVGAFCERPEAWIPPPDWVATGRRCPAAPAPKSMQSEQQDEYQRVLAKRRAERAAAGGA